MNTQNLPERAPLSPKWQFRFDFFDRHGGPASPDFKAAFKALPSFGDRLKINMNFFAFFFGWIYFFILGLWRKAIVLIGISLLIGVLSFFLPGMVVNGLGVGYSVLVGLIANYAFYLDRKKGSTSWNPFEGMRWW
ncbi:DUF2628 domain-containing protein [Xanthomonas hyacinthi]|uniref:DUF2628 domain-containing protein n=1 Tax=Xanthomonas hyacinthi TaxID=56455 RepID=A0A2S7EY05_9XANT|nr:DUF2628 domain-containing protein [Xanthomonas hyacinthi]KLD79255.1 membrane protein [Xanthomonas hyacinthi DSM 19077]PPU97915.1 DUF2628 domain-containing protein [Xanthomonas hyacinthi]QGY76550.1 DUF2628 domain-containing protein [Xanthomonas hyacinthi]